MRSFKPLIAALVLALVLFGRVPGRAATPREIYGKVGSINGSRLTIQTRTGTVVQVDATEAIQAHRAVPLVAGHAVVVRGTSDAKGVFHADTILRAKESAATWPADR